MADETEGEDGRDRGLAEGQREWLQQRPSLGFCYSSWAFTPADGFPKPLFKP